jgi:hypothetical protein
MLSLRSFNWFMAMVMTGEVVLLEGVLMIVEGTKLVDSSARVGARRS